MTLNLHDEYGDYGIGVCNNTGNYFYFDMNDVDIVCKHCWYERVDTTGYSSLMATTSGQKKSIKMHQLFGFANCDHIDRNPLNNRRSNLRQATASQQNMNQGKQSNNTSGVIGVCWHKDRNKWNAFISISGKRKHLGYFLNKDDAICTRLKAEKEYYGEFAPQKHLYTQYGID